MVKWQVMCRPKNLGGLSIINTSVMDKCLIIKWWWRILNSDPKALWFQILKAKYFPNSSPLFASANGGSQFWRQLVSVCDDFRSLLKFSVGDGTSIHCWLDWWTGDGPLSVAFPVLFSYVSSPKVSIAELSARNWDLSFHRVLSPEELED